MKSAVEILESQRATLEQLLREYLLDCSGLRELEMGGHDFVIIGPNHAWEPLDARGRALQAPGAADRTAPAPGP